MSIGMVQEQNLEKQIEKQMGCMAGFLQLFDRHQLLTGKRLYSPKRLTPSSSSAIDSTSDSEKSTKSLSMSTGPQDPPSPDRSSTKSTTPYKPIQPLSVFEFKESTRSNASTWKFREAPRLSLDSRATFDAKGSLYPKQIKTNAAILSTNQCTTPVYEEQRKSTSVVARLMGLEPLPNSCPDNNATTNKSSSPQLRRSASESRVSRDLCNNFPPPDISRENGFVAEAKMSDPIRIVKPDLAKRGMEERRQQQQRKSFFDSADFFPEPKQTVSIYGEIEKRLKMRGIDEPSKDLETLKQILEALQLKGLLHSSNKKTAERVNQRNFVYDNRTKNFDSPIVVMKPSARYESPPPNTGFRSRRNGDNTTSPRTVRVRNASSPTRSESSVQSSSSVGRRKVLNAETQRVEQRRVSSPVHSPRISSSVRRNVVDQARFPRNRRPTAEIYPKEKVAIHVEDESSSISESSFSTSSERTKEGRSILERCDKLLHSIAEMTAPESQQPSPVSVLDSSFYKDESASPSPVMKRSMDFKDLAVDFDDEIWCPSILTVESNPEGGASDDQDFIYISDILRASNYLPEDSDVFLLLEKQQYLRGKDTSKVSTLERKLIFDTIYEILDRNRQLPPWKAVSETDFSIKSVWSEFMQIRERHESEDLLEVICGVLKKDLGADAINGWGERHVEFSDAVLDIERLIFKDLVGETIRNLASVTGKCTLPRRKLMF